MDKKLFSIAIPVYNHARYLDYALKSIEIQKYPKEKYEILLLDSSKDKTQVESLVVKYDDLPIRYFHWKKLVPNDIAFKHNKALSQAVGEYYVITGADLLHITPTLFRLEREFNLNPLAFIGGVAFDLEKDWEKTYPNWQDNPKILLSNRSLEMPNELPNGSFMAVQTNVIRLIGGYDEKFTQYGHEDTDLALRLTLFKFITFKPCYRVNAILGHLNPLPRKLNIDSGIYFTAQALNYIIRNYSFRLSVNKETSMLWIGLLKGHDRGEWIRNKCKNSKKILHVGSAGNEIFRGSDLEKYVTPLDIDLYDLPRFIQLDAADLITYKKSGIKDNEYDTVVLAEILEHVKDPITVLKGAKRVGRRLVITVPDPANWDLKYKPYQTIEEEIKVTGLTQIESARRSNPMAKELYTKDNCDHMFHHRWYTEKMLRDHLSKAGIFKYKLDTLAYDGWSFFVVEAFIEEVK